MGTDYPEHLLAREPAPPYDGEGAIALWHFSEDPSLGWFRPRPPGANRDTPPVGWAIDTRHAPMFWFPGDCPRGCIWPSWRRVANSTVEYSGSRLRNSAPHPDRFG